MPDITSNRIKLIKDLPIADIFNSFELIPVVQQGTTKQAKILDVGLYTKTLDYATWVYANTSNLSIVNSITAPNLSSSHFSLFTSQSGNPIFFIGQSGLSGLSGVDTLSGFNTVYDLNENKYYISTVGISTSPLTAITITRTGNVGIFTTNPNERLTINGNISSSSIIYDPVGNSTNWNSVFSNVNSNSSNFLQSQTFVNSNSANILQVNSTVNSTSANWNSVFSNVNSNSSNFLQSQTFVNSNSANILQVNSRVNTTSANWNSVFSNVNSNSSNFLQSQTFVNSNSANILQVNSTFNSNSATYATIAFTDSKFLPLTGGTVNSLWVWNLTANAFTQNIVQPATSTTLGVSFSATIGTNLEVGGFTRIGSTLTVGNTISSNNIIYDSVGNSTNWNNVFSNVRTNSATYATYNYVNNGFLPLSGGTVSGATRINNNLTINGQISSNNTITANLFAGSGASLTNIPNSATTATSSNTNSAIVARDASGNFIAGNITANLTGTASQIADGSVSTSAKITNGVVTAAKLSTGAPTWDTFGTLTTSGTVGIGTSTPRAQQHISGDGQRTAALTDLGSRSGMLRVSDTSSLANAGGAILFANGQGDTANSVGFAAIKGLLVDGSNNTAGSLAISTRNNTTDTALTERLRILANGNVGIGTSSPLEKLEVVGGNLISRAGTQYGGIAVRDNNNNTIGYILGTSTTNDSGQIGLLSGTVQRVTINSAGDTYFNGGNVGIGTASPITKLDVAGFIRGVGQLVTDGAAATYRFLRLATNNVARWDMGITDDAESGTNTGSNFFLHRFNDIGSFLERVLHISRASGNVGIGTSSPTEKLDVNGNVKATTFSGSGASLTNIPNSATTATSSNTNSAIVARDASGNFIAGNITANLTGTASQIADGSVSTSAKITNGVVTAAKLSIGAPSWDTSGNLSIGKSIALTGTSTDYSLVSITNSSGVQVHLNANGNTEGNLRTVTNHRLSFSTNNTERAVIDTSGNVGIGTITPASRLDVQNGTSEAQIRVGPSTTTGYIYGNSSQIGFWCPDGGAVQINRASRDVSITGNIANSGNITSSGNELVISDGNGSNDTGRGANTASINFANGTFVNHKLESQGEVIGGLAGGSNPYGQLRAVSGTIGAMIRNDGTDTYLPLLTNSGDPYGVWNGLRPIRINNTTGNIVFANGNTTLDHANGNIVTNGTITTGGNIIANAPARFIGINVPTYQYLNADSGAIINGQVYPTGNFSGLVNSGVYELLYELWFVKNTAGTVNYTLALNGGWFWWCTGEAVHHITTGAAAWSAPTKSRLNTAQYATIISFPAATASLTTGVMHQVSIRYCFTGYNLNQVYLNIVQSGGSITPLAGSYAKITRIA